MKVSPCARRPYVHGSANVGGVPSRVRSVVSTGAVGEAGEAETPPHAPANTRSQGRAERRGKSIVGQRSVATYVPPCASLCRSQAS